MSNKLIYLEEHEDKYLRDTWVELIGDGLYAITQTGCLSGKGERRIVYLTHKQLEEILMEQEVALPTK